MANATLTLNIKTEFSQASLLARLIRDPNSGREEFINEMIVYFRALGLGADLANIDAQTSADAPVAASHTITCDQSAVTAEDEIIVLGVTLTAKASGANGTDEFNAITDDATMAANLAACINANTTLSKYVSASSAAGVVTVAALIKGSVGNVLIQSALGTITSGTPFVISGAYVGGTGGSEGAVTNYKYGIA